ncbi:MAG: response regulator, partial [Deltaproteobacteria bacterium]|nr:response regulator [Deltaproteobacteria bacterium]
MSTVSTLVVDDDRTLREGCREVLQRLGHRVAEAESGDGALERLAREAFDLVLLDLRLPGRGGMEVLAWIRAHAPSTAVVVITGFATVDLAVEAMRLGA